MFYPYAFTQQLSNYGASNVEAKVRKSALQFFEYTVYKGRLHRFWLTLTKKSNRLLSLAEVAAATASNRYYLGRRTVSLDQIQGSSGRVGDFDRRFVPLHSHLEQRWVRVAMAYERGVLLPPVKLIQIGEIYYVEDGHHRVSVAKALGLLEIEAEVHVWQSSSK